MVFGEWVAWASGEALSEADGAGLARVLLAIGDRPGLRDLVGSQLEAGFATAPASRGRHLCRPGGLLSHSLNVARGAMASASRYGLFDASSAALCGLCHDMCKTRLYVEREPTPDDPSPYGLDEAELARGHGEYSRAIVEGFMDISEAEALAIEWHMGMYDHRLFGKDVSKAARERALPLLTAARDAHPLVDAVHIADMEAASLAERWM